MGITGSFGDKRPFVESICVDSASLDCEVWVATACLSVRGGRGVCASVARHEWLGFRCELGKDQCGEESEQCCLWWVGRSENARESLRSVGRLGH